MKETEFLSAFDPCSSVAMCYADLKMCLMPRMGMMTQSGGYLAQADLTMFFAGLELQFFCAATIRVRPSKRSILLIWRTSGSFSGVML